MTASVSIELGSADTSLYRTAFVGSSKAEVLTRDRAGEEKEEKREGEMRGDWDASLPSLILYFLLAPSILGGPGPFACVPSL